MSCVRAHLFEPPLSEKPKTKHQIPSSREVPNLKHQTSKSDAGANGALVGFRAWSLEIGNWELFAGLSASQKLRYAPVDPALHLTFDLIPDFSCSLEFFIFGADER